MKSVINRLSRLIAAGSLASVMLTIAVPQSARSESLRFVALGDVPYGTRSHPTKRDDEYRKLIEKVNRERPAFTFHVGDTKSGSSSCTDAMLEKQLGFMNQYEMPLVYTPGDNEWSDCGAPSDGKTLFAPEGRLTLIRQMYFADSRTLGRNPMALVRQPQVMPQHSEFVENARFVRDDVVFVTLHTVGDDNNYENDLGDCEQLSSSEFCSRQTANIAWLRAAFKLAKDGAAKAVVVVTHADLFRDPSTGNEVNRDAHGVQMGFSRLVLELVSQAKRFGGPILLIHGDKHDFTTDNPFKSDDGSPVSNITRLRVPGKKDVQAVRVTVKPSDTPVFEFKRLDP